MDTTLSLKDWLNQSPLPTEIRYNDDGSAYIPIEFIKPKLDYLSPLWSTSMYHHFFTEMPVYDKAGNKTGTTLWVSGSVELIIQWQEQFDSPISNPMSTGLLTFGNFERNITGSATFDVQKYYPNNNWGATCLSLCIVAAAKELGPFFGKELNKENLTVPTDTKKVDKRQEKVQKTIKGLELQKT